MIDCTSSAPGPQVIKRGVEIAHRLGEKDAAASTYRGEYLAGESRKAYDEAWGAVRQKAA